MPPKGHDVKKYNQRLMGAKLRTIEARQKIADRNRSNRKIDKHGNIDVLKVHSGKYRNEATGEIVYVDGCYDDMVWIDAHGEKRYIRKYVFCMKYVRARHE